jgi:hypothetical protein
VLFFRLQTGRQEETLLIPEQAGPPAVETAG